MVRVSVSIFEVDGYDVKYDRKSLYLTCNCMKFSSEGKCDHIDSPKEILKSEGFEVKLKRVKKPIFIEEIDKFIISAKAVLNV